MAKIKYLRYIYTIIIFLFIGECFASNDSTCLFLITFKDKKATTYNINNPSSFLSAKALARRTKMKIGIDTLDLPVPKQYIDSVLIKGLVYRTSVRWFNSIVVIAPDSASAYNVQSLPFVKSVKYVGKDKAKQKRTVGENEESNYISGMPDKISNYGQTYNQISMLRGDLMHDQGYLGEGIDIAILDAGFLHANSVKQLAHLFANNQVLGTYNIAENKTDVYNVPTGSHGEMVLSIMASFSDGDMIGGAPNANYWLFRTEVATGEYIVEEYYWAAGAAYADSVGASIISSSLGYTTFDDASMNHSFNTLDGRTAPGSIAATIASRKGVVVVNSAGNEGNSAWRRIGVPADADSILAIGAVDAQRVKAGFSSVGNTKDGRIKPDVDAMGLNTTVASTSSVTMQGNGTSFSCPLIASLLATLIQANPNATNMQIIDALKKSASQYNNPDSLLGFGIPNFNLANLFLKNLNITKQTNSNLISIFPNPIKDNFSALYFSADSQNVVLLVSDTSGKIISKRELSIKPNGYYKWDFDSSLWRSGLYMVRLYSGKTELFSAKVVKQ